MKKDYKRDLFVKEENVVDVIEVLEDLGMEKPEVHYGKVAFFSEDVSRNISFKCTDERLDDILRNLKEMKVKVLCMTVLDYKEVV